MAQFTVNTNRFDPYKNFKFRLKWDGRYVAGQIWDPESETERRFEASEVSRVWRN